MTFKTSTVRSNGAGNWLCGKCEQEKMFKGKTIPDPIPQHFRTCKLRKKVMSRVAIRNDICSGWKEYGLPSKSQCKKIVDDVLDLISYPSYE